MFKKYLAKDPLTSIDDPEYLNSDPLIYLLILYCDGDLKDKSFTLFSFMKGDDEVISDPTLLKDFVYYVY